MKGRGYTVLGSDRGARTDFYTDEHGIPIWRERRELPPDTTLVVYSLAIDSADPQIIDAEKRGLTTVSRAQLLGALMSMSPHRICVSGSHGKSTTTALVEHILTESGRGHTAVSGATLSSGRAYADTGDDFFLAEACEYKDSFLSLCPTHQIITSVELDHTDYFATLEDIKRSFLRASRLAETLIINLDDPVAREIADELSDSKYGEKLYTPTGYMAKNDQKRPNTVITYGKSEGADFKIHGVTHTDDKTSFSLTYDRETLRLTTSLIGDFNLYNIASATALAISLGVDRESVVRAVGSFLGIERRLSLLGAIEGVPVYYDYAHHPREIASVIEALRERYGRLTVIFRPHTYSRTASLWQDFITALSKADRVILLDVFPAREKPIDGVSSKRLAECIEGAIYCPGQSDAIGLVEDVKEGAIALLGAGEVEQVKSDLIAKCKKHG